MASTTSARYLPHGPFHTALHQRVTAHFAARGESPQSARGRLFKTAVISGWLVLSYVALVFVASSAWAAVLCAASLGLAMAGVGFAIQHDGSHGGYSPHPRLNALMAFGLDAVGGSSYVWRWKHNVFHHSNPNVAGHDADIDIQPFCRMAPAQPRRAAHRYQHLYVWFLYALLTFKWHFVDDFKDVWQGRIGGMKFPRPKGWALFAFLAGKAFFFSWALVIPLLLHPVWVVVALYAVTSVITSLTLALTFQMAHATDGAHFAPAGAEPLAEREWSAHQAETSLNFSTGNRLLTWYVGGLNHQIEHHLFPRISHLHLPAISGIVRSTCAEFAVSYRSQPSVAAALRAHVRWIRRMGTQA